MIKKVLLFFMTALFFVGCSKFFYKSPYGQYNHETHVEILFKQNRDCFYCHKLPDIETIKIDNKGLSEIKPELEIEGKCHSCHKEPETKIAKAPEACSTCHQNMKLMKPKSHVNEWERLHGVPAKLNQKDCASCHSEWYCENCHTEQYALKYSRHPRNFKIYHSLEASIDPGSCGSCHREYFCVDCHRD